MRRKKLEILNRYPASKVNLPSRHMMLERRCMDVETTSSSSSSSS